MYYCLVAITFVNDIYDEYDLDLGDELCITKREELKTTKFELKK